MKVQREAIVEESKNYEDGFNDDKADCLHDPQCIIRRPKPPPLGPQTLKQTEMDDIIVQKETIARRVMEFMEDEPGDTLDITIAKLECLKT